MKPGGGKAKGSSFERDICKALSLWVSHGKREDLYWRSAMSGGRATVGRRKGLDLQRHAGDISATHPDGHALTDLFFIECKFIKDLRLGQWVVGAPSVIGKFWNVAQEQSEDHNLQPMLIAKQNAGPIIMVVDYLTGSHYSWARSSLLARVYQPNITVLLFEAVLEKPFTTRVTR